MKVLIILNQLLSERNMSQHELSRLTGIRQATISDICINKTKRVPLDNLAIICKTLTCEITDVLMLVDDCE